jgi:class 3 adenylate cyclase
MAVTSDTPRHPDDLSPNLAAAVDAVNLRWEIGIQRIMVGLILAATVMVMCISPWIGTELAVPEIVLCGLAVSHFAISSLLLQWRAGRWLEHVRWFSVTAEASFATVAITIGAIVKGPEWAATSPTVLIYALAIAICSIRIRPRLTMYCTLVACVQYLVLSTFYLQPAMSGAAVGTALGWAAWERAFWLLLIGGCATFATHQVRRVALAGHSQAVSRAWVLREMSKFLPAEATTVALSGMARGGLVDRRQVTVLFCDLRDFTGLCERERPDDVIQLLNEFYARACAIVRGHGGQVNKFLGDGLLVLFDDAHTPDHPDAAVRAGRELVAAAAALRKRGGIWEQLSIAVGLDTGPVLVGTVGADDRLELTAIGSAVNRAARLQSVARFAPTRIIVSDSCAEQLSSAIEVRSLGAVDVKGFDQSVGIFTPVPQPTKATRRRRYPTATTAPARTPS